VPPARGLRPPLTSGTDPRDEPLTNHRRGGGAFSGFSLISCGFFPHEFEGSAVGPLTADHGSLMRSRPNGLFDDGPQTDTRHALGLQVSRSPREWLYALRSGLGGLGASGITIAACGAFVIGAGVFTAPGQPAALGSAPTQRFHPVAPAEHALATAAHRRTVRKHRARRPHRQPLRPAPVAAVRSRPRPADSPQTATAAAAPTLATSAAPPKEVASSAPAAPAPPPTATVPAVAPPSLPTVTVPAVGVPALPPLPSTNVGSVLP
jgi:hypothetical protein